MKKTILSLSLACLSLLSFAQGQINTRKMIIADITSRTMKVVLTSNPFYDGLLKDEFAMRWHISPYEFCTLEEFEKLKTDGDTYFFLMTSGKFKKESEPGIQFLSVLKGGEKAAKGLDDMFNVVTMPFAAADSPNGRETVFLPAFLDIMQEFIMTSMESDKDAYAGLQAFAIPLKQSKEMDVILADQDMSDEIKSENFDQYNIKTMDEDACDEYMLGNVSGVLVSYTVCPADPQPGSYCYKLLIDSGTHSMYYFKKHRISKKTGAGFLKNDIVRIREERKGKI